MSETAVARLLALKNRSAEKGFILVASELKQLESFIDLSLCERKDQIVASWPGPVTWVVPAGPSVPKWLSGYRATIAVRVTEHVIAAALCRAFRGAIISTSANLSGSAPARCALAARKHFHASTLVFGGPTGNLGKPTAIYDALSGRQLR
jgi:L-threonylcarbamoyladenylate synthase